MKACNQCGKCCIKYSHGGLSATADEVAYWETFRPDIADYVDGTEIWIDPETGKSLMRCPWLRQQPGQEIYSCDIYLDRPDDCKSYPVNITQMVEDDCEMIEVRDIQDLPAAQVKLDKMMIASRPASS